MLKIIKFLLSSFILSSFFGLPIAFSQEKESSSDTTTSIQNIVRVARSGGDFSNVNEAIASISGASARNPVLVDIAPGIFNVTQPIVLQQHVHLRGSGAGITTLFGNIGGASFSDSNASMIRGFNNTSIQDLSLSNKSTGSAAIGIYYGQGSSCGIQSLSIPEAIKNVSVRINGTANNKMGIKADCERIKIQDIDVELFGGDSATGIDASLSFNVVIDNAEIFIGYAENTLGAYLLGGNSEVKNSNIRTIGKLTSQGTNVGMRVDQLISLSQSTIIVIRGTAVVGVQVFSPGGSLVIENNSTIEAGGGSISSFAVSAIESTGATINDSSLFGSVEFGPFEGVSNFRFRAFRSIFNSPPTLLVNPGECLLSHYRIPGGGGTVALPTDCIVPQ